MINILKVTVVGIEKSKGNDNSKPWTRIHCTYEMPQCNEKKFYDGIGTLSFFLDNSLQCPKLGDILQGCWVRDSQGKSTFDILA